MLCLFLWQQPQIKEEVDLIIKQNPELCRGFYGQPSPMDFSLGGFADQFNTIMRYFRNSFELFRKYSRNEILEDVPAWFKFLSDDARTHSVFTHLWFRWVFEFEKQKKGVLPGCAVKLKLPGNFTKAINDIKNSHQYTPTPVDDWVLIHRITGDIQLLRRKNGVGDLHFDRILQILENEKDFVWRSPL